MLCTRRAPLHGSKLKTSLPNPIHFDVLSPVFRAVDASGASIGPVGRRPIGEPKLIPGNVMRHMQRNFGVGGLTGKPLPVPGVVIEGKEKLGSQILHNVDII